MTWGQVGALAGTLAVVVGAVMAVIAYFSRTKIEVGPQPLTVEVVKALHDQFANLEEFKQLAKHTTERHGQLFKSIERAREDARAELGAAVNAINADRAQTMTGLRKDFDSIRSELTDQGKDISGLQTATDLQTKQLSNMDAKLDRLIERNNER